MKTNDFYVTESICDANTWFIFRENGIEVKIVLEGKKFKASKELTNTEVEYLNTNLR